MNHAVNTYHTVGTLDARKLLATRFTQAGGQLPKATPRLVSRVQKSWRAQSLAA